MEANSSMPERAVSAKTEKKDEMKKGPRTKKLKIQIMPSGCHEVVSHAVKPNGYITIQRGLKTILVHRYVWEQFNGPIPKGMCVCHKCDNRKCVNINHLFLGTYKDNYDDMKMKGRRGYTGVLGIKNGNAKLSRRQVIKIKDALLKGVSTYRLSKYFDVSESCIWNIKNKHTWKNVRLAPLEKV